MSPLHFALVVQMIEREATQHKGWANVDVQVWRDKEHLTTHKILNYQDFVFPAALEPQTIEQWASIATRILARMVEEYTYSRIQEGELVHLAAIQETFPEVAIQTD